MLCMVLKYDEQTHRTVGVNEDGSTTEDLNKVSLLPEDDAFALAERVGGGVEAYEDIFPDDFSDFDE